uniref:Zinc finger CCCH domain-containing protein 4 n=1 Tax=Lygus hesperus TaxID=30085 RepID=A0A0A9ZIQ1_LYGHE
MQQTYGQMQGGQYARPAYSNGYSPMPPSAHVQPYASQPGYMSQQYQYPGYGPAAYYQQSYGMPGVMYPVRPARMYDDGNGYEYNRGMRGANMYYTPRPRGEYVGYGGDGGYNSNNGNGGYRYNNGRGGFGFRGRRRRPFVGGTLESQREFERQTACCFFLQGKCKFGDLCRFVHKNDTDMPCQFGDNCNIHGSRMHETEKSKKDTDAANTHIEGDEPKTVSEKEVHESKEVAKDEHAESTVATTDTEKKAA